jgi:putative membrane protein
MKNLLLRWGVLALGVMIATRVIPGIRCDDLITLIVVVLVLSFLNAVLRPVLLLVSLPLIILTLGFGVVLVNAFLFELVSWLVSPSFHVESFWSSLGGSLVVSLTNLVFSRVIKPRPAAPKSPQQPPAPRGPGKGGDVIDI